VEATPEMHAICWPLSGASAVYPRPSRAFCPNSDAFSPFVRHFSKNGEFAFGLPEKSNRNA
jgi:hypothetical protein